MTQNKRTISGFTLLELLVVLTIAALLITVTGPRFSVFHSRASFNKLSQTLTTSLRQARNLADRESRIIKITLDADERLLLLDGEEIIFNWPDDSSLVLINSSAEAQEQTSLLFLPGGGSSGGLLRLSQQQGDQQRKQDIQIHWLTGGVQYVPL